MSNELTSYEKIEKVLFKKREDVEDVLSKTDLDKKDRWMLCVSKMLSDPITQDQELVNFLMNGCGGACKPVSASTAYRDIAAVKKLVGNIQLASKSWYRYIIIEAAKEGIRIAKENKDAKGIAANIDKLGKYTRADKEDMDIDRSKWTPPVFEPSDDVTLLGDNFKPIKDLEKERKEFRALFKNDPNIMDVEAEIVKDNEDGEEVF